jgi:hypothetical protein
MQLRGCKIRNAGQQKPEISNLLDRYSLTQKKIDDPEIRDAA